MTHLTTKLTIVMAFLLISLSKISEAQNTKEFNMLFEQAQDEIKQKNFYQALPLYLQLYELDNTNNNISYLVGICYANARVGRAKAIPYFEKAILNTTTNYKSLSSEEKLAPTLAFKMLADEYHGHSQFEKAIETYRKYISEMASNKESDKVNLKDANRKIEMCNNAINFIKNPVAVKVENMGKNVNSVYGDYSPVLTIDQNTMIFTSRRNVSTGGKIYDNGRYYEDIYITQQSKKGWDEAKNIGVPINTDGNEASVGISPDGQQILIYKDDKGDGNIYSTSLNGNIWSEPVKLNDNINSKHWEPSAFISADGQTIYFTSDRPGGYGGRDLYMSYKDEKNDWGKAINLGATINTEYDEDAPFIHPDGITLFFSSNGHNTIGGFDIFYATLLEDGTNWQEPINVGYPINSPDDDVFFVVSPDKTTAYYSSFKEGGVGEKDNYKVTFTNLKQAPLVVVKGNVIDANNNVPKGIEITVTNNETGKTLGVYRPNSITGIYMFVLTPGKNYNISYEADGFMFYSENRTVSKKTNYFETYKNITLAPIVVGSKVVLNNIFFDFDKYSLRSTSNVELRNIIRFMKKYSKINVEIAGYTDSKGTKEYNQNLSEKRANEVVTYLIANGISSNRLNAKGYGEQIPDAPNEDNEGNDNPEGRQLNRRVELKIIEITK